MSNEVVISVENLWKEYRYGTISHATLRKDLQSWWASLRSKPDPNIRIDFNQARSTKKQSPKTKDQELRTKNQSPDGDSFWVRIPGATNLTPGEDPDNPGTGWVRWSDPPDSDNWYWNDVFSGDHGNAVANWTLAAGTHTLEIARREDGALLDIIVISKID